jgi:hypothetical protein
VARSPAAAPKRADSGGEPKVKRGRPINSKLIGHSAVRKPHRSGPRAKTREEAKKPIRSLAPSGRYSEDQVNPTRGGRLPVTGARHSYR